MAPFAQRRKRKGEAEIPKQGALKEWLSATKRRTPRFTQQGQNFVTRKIKIAGAVIAQRCLNGRSAGTIKLKDEQGDGWWRAFVSYDCRQPTLAHRIRSHLGAFPYDDKWIRLGDWMQPGPNCKIAYGPKMFGDKPLATGTRPGRSPRATW